MALILHAHTYYYITAPKSKILQVTVIMKCLYFFSSPKCGDKVEVYASGWKVGTSCPAYQGPYNKEIILGKSIYFALNVGEIKMTADTTVGNGRGFRVKYSFEGE